MTDQERQELWVRLQKEKADALETQAIADAAADLATSRRMTDRLATIDHALRSLTEAESIRVLLAKIDTIGQIL